MHPPWYSHSPVQQSPVSAILCCITSEPKTQQLKTTNIYHPTVSETVQAQLSGMPLGHRLQSCPSALTQLMVSLRSSWLLARDVNSFPCRPLHRAAGSLQSKASKRERRYTKQTPEVLCHHFHCVLFTRGKSVSPAHTQVKSMNTGSGKPWELS